MSKEKGWHETKRRKLRPRTGRGRRFFHEGEAAYLEDEKRRKESSTRRTDFRSQERMSSAGGGLLASIQVFHLLGRMKLIYRPGPDQK